MTYSIVACDPVTGEFGKLLHSLSIVQNSFFQLI